VKMPGFSNFLRLFVYVVMVSYSYPKAVVTDEIRVFEVLRVRRVEKSGSRQQW
jgi:hypothetical protein